MLDTLMIVDDHDMFRDGIVSLVKFKKIAKNVVEASNGQEFIELLKETTPQVVLLDISMPIMNGVEAAEIALKKYPDLNIIILSMYGDEDYYYKMINIGVNGFILKTSGKDELEKAIEKAAKGDSYFSSELLHKIIQNINKNKKPKNPKPGIHFTPREREVLHCLCNGLTASQIAMELHLSKKTIEGYRTKLFHKTNTKNSISLVVFAIKNKIVELT